MSKMQIQSAVQDDIMYRFVYDNKTDTTVAEVAYALAKAAKTVTIPNSVQQMPVKMVAAGAFAQMRQLEEVYIESSESLRVCKSAFALCPNLRKVESSTDTLILDKKAFFDNPSLEEFYCYGKLDLAAENIFFKCPKLRKIHGRIKVLRPYALSGAMGLERLCIDKNAQIYEGAFNGCSVSELWFMGNVEFISPANPEMLRNYKILCRNGSNLTDLAYEGYDIETSSLINLSAF